FLRFSDLVEDLLHDLLGRIRRQPARDQVARYDAAFDVRIALGAVLRDVLERDAIGLARRQPGDLIPPVSPRRALIAIGPGTRGAGAVLDDDGHDVRRVDGRLDHEDRLRHAAVAGRLGQDGPVFRSGRRDVFGID